MPAIIWSDSFSVGVKMLDDQHKTLVAIINQLVDVVEGQANPSVISDLIAAMIEYAATHFDDEERLMRSHNYPDFETQRMQHGEFIAKTGEFIKHTADFGDDGGLHVTSISAEALEYLRNWWTHHILIEDMAYKSFFQEKKLTRSERS